LSAGIRHKNVYIALQQQLATVRRKSARRYTSRRKTMIVSHIIERVRAYLRYRASVRALSVLSERELADIGLSRGQIEDAARKSVFA
jgi:uncharacterized protein YjiS (DUF1127 family)